MVGTLQQLREGAIKLQQQGKQAEAANAYAQYLSQRPDDAAAWSNLGVLHRAAGRHAQALRAQERALRLKPDDAGALNNMANILSDLGHYDRSIAYRRKLLEMDPNNANQLSMIGRCLRGQGNYAQAIEHLKAALSHHPDHADMRLQLAFAQLGSGDYAAGFDAYQARWETGELTARKLPYPKWQGEDLSDKTILVMPEQGFGDAVLFARFIPYLKELGATVHVLVEKPLVTLFANLKGADWAGPAVGPENRIDFYIDIVDLAAVYFQQNETVPEPSCLHVPDDSIERAKRIVKPFTKQFKIGVVWTGSVTYKANAFRSFSHTDFLPLTDIDGVQLFSLYKGPLLGPFATDGSSAFIIDTGSSERGFADTAATMQQMDLIITSDTATAHIAGSLGVPTWVVLHWDAFWVWRHHGDTTEWYPSVRLFRQDKPLDWTGAHSKVKTALIDYLKAQ